MKKTWKRLISVLLSVVMIAAIAVPTFAYDFGKSEAKSLDWEKISERLFNEALFRKGITTTESEPEFADTDVVRVSIILASPSVVEAGYPTENIAVNADAMQYRGKLQDKQDAITAAVSAKALGGKKLDVVWNLTLAANIISANVPYGKIDAIKSVAGVKDVVLETRYDPEKAEKTDGPNMSVASDMTGGMYAWLSGYTGAGSKVAIIDTGLDTDHQSFSSEAFDYAIAEIEEETGKEIDLLTEEEVAAVLSQLHAAERFEGLTAEDLYLGTKVPFAFNYVDKDLDVTHDNDKQEEHGSHVAGIAAANRYIKTEEGFVDALDYVKTQGEAPDAQIIVMKVFGKGGGAYDSDYFAAIEDAIILGCDSVNLSLGSAATGLVRSDKYQAIMDNLENTSLLMVCSGGNSYSWPNFTYPGFLYSDDVNMGRTGSPGSFTNSLTVASVDNDGTTGPYLTVADKMIFYSETATYGNEPISTIGDTEYDYVYIDSVGTEEEFAAVADVLKGKIAICNRGETSFYQKANNAVANGAVAVLIANNQDGVINMNLTGYEYTAPAVSITLADGEFIKENSDYVEGEAISYYTGKIFVGKTIGSVSYDSFFYKMSDFSSWGINGNLQLKPEITAPGGNIYSVNGLPKETDQYETMSGTSMAAPQIAGLAAVLAQYLRETGLLEKTGLTTRQLTNSLLMSTAEPLREEEAVMMEYYSVMKQGAGLVRIDQAISAQTYIMMDESATVSAKDGKIKAEIGETDGHFSIKFTVNNFTDKDIQVDFNAEFFTQDVFEYYTYDSAGIPMEDENGYPIISDYLDTLMTYIPSDGTWYLDGEEFVFYTDESLIEKYDVNADGDWDEYDALDLLAFITGEIDELENIELADVNHDGKIDTSDAAEMLKALNAATAVVPANGSLDVELEVEIYTEYFDMLTEIGNYVEGYVFITEEAPDEMYFGVTHSIPVIGFYGDWSTPSMFDKGSAIEYFYGEEYRTPYMAYVNGSDAYGTQTFLADVNGTDYPFGGNPLEYDGTYLPERDAVSSDFYINGIRYTQIRNGGAQRVCVYADDELVYEEIGGASYASYYNVNNEEWYNTSTITDFNFKVDGLEDGTKLRYELTIAPEYYVDDEGNVDWDALGEGTTRTIEAVVDNSAPVAEDINIGYSMAEKDFGMTVKAKDNEYIAGVAVYAFIDGETVLIDFTKADLAAGAGEDYEAFLPLDLFYKDEESGLVLLLYPYLYIEVYDYALNMTTYKINVNTSELADPQLDLLMDEQIMIIGNGSKQINYIPLPWGIEEYDSPVITFESQDESVVTVDENGVVTSVCDDSSQTTVTATITLGEASKSVDCLVNVVFLDVTLNAAIWDEEGDVWFSEFDIMRLPNYTKLTEEKANAAIGSIAIDNHGLMFGATIDEDDKSVLYLIDENYELTEIGESTVPFFDLTAAPALGDYMFLAAYGPYILVVDMTVGDYISIFDMSNFTGGASIVGIAYEERYDHKDYGACDFVFFVDEEGTLYETGFLAVGDSFSRFGVQTIGSFGYTTDSYMYNSLYFDGMNLYWSKFSSARNNVELILGYDIYNDGSITSLGAFDPGVWPVAGLYEEGFSLPLYYYYEDGEAGNSARFDTFKLEASASESLDLTKPDAIKHVDSINELAETEISTEITVGKDVNNGLIVIDYDPDLVEIAVEPVPEISSVNEIEEGHILIAFADGEIIPAGTVVANLAAKLVSGAEGSVIYVWYKDGCGDIEYETIVLGEAETGEVETDPVVGVEWAWNEDHTEAKATFTTESGQTFELDAEVILKNTATCLCDGVRYSTALVRYDDTIYTDTYVVETFATGHNYGTPVILWEDDYSAAYLHIMCENNCLEEDWWLVFGATLEVEEVPADCENDGYTKITATVDFEAYIEQCMEYAQMYLDMGIVAGYNYYVEMAEQFYGYIELFGQSLFTDTVVLPGEPAHHSYEVEWNWSEDLSTAEAVFTCTGCGDEQRISATITSEVVDGSLVYTATVEFEGETYTDTVTVTVVGDANGDGVLDGKDLIRLRKYLASYDPSLEEQEVEIFVGADVNNDGKIDGRDLIALRKLLAGSEG